MKRKIILTLVIVFGICGLFVNNGFSDRLIRSDGDIADAPVISGTYSGTQDVMWVGGIPIPIYKGAISGLATNDDGGLTYGVYGSSAGKAGIAVWGWAASESGRTYGVYGAASSPTGYGVYSQGNMRVVGDLTVTGALPEYTNIAPSATVSASSEFNITTYADDNIRDRRRGLWDIGEWATAGEKGGAWIQLNIPAQNVNVIFIYPRPNRYDQIYDAWLQIQRSDGVTDLHLGQFSNGGAPREVHLTAAEGTNVVAVKVLITETSPETLNIGLSEMEMYFNPNLW